MAPLRKRARTNDSGNGNDDVIVDAEDVADLEDVVEMSSEEEDDDNDDKGEGDEETEEYDDDENEDEDDEEDEEEVEVVRPPVKASVSRLKMFARAAKRARAASTGADRRVFTDGVIAMLEAGGDALLRQIADAHAGPDGVVVLVGTLSDQMSLLVEKHGLHFVERVAEDVFDITGMTIQVEKPQGGGNYELHLEMDDDDDE